MKIKQLLENKKGEGMVDFAVGGVIGFIVVAVILYVMFPILAGVNTATPTITNAALLGAQGNVTNSIASGAALTGIAEIVIPAVVILGVLMIGLVHRKK